MSEGSSEHTNDYKIQSQVETILVQEKQIIVKYFLETTKKLLFTNSYSPTCLVASIKKNIERYFNVPFVNIILKVGNRILENEDKIGDFGSDDFGILEVTLAFTNANLKLESEDVTQIYQHVPPVLPDVLTVQVPTEDKGVYNVVVEVENKCIYKPNLGGYQNRATGVEYHNAYSQTGPNRPRRPGALFNHRDTQTASPKNKTVEVGVSKCTQANGISPWVPEVTDKIIVAKKYETAEEKETRLDVMGKVTHLQRCVRAWILRRRIRHLSGEYRRLLKEEEEREIKEEVENAERLKKDLINKAFPVNKEDFDMVYSMIERWKKAEIDKITRYYCGPAKIVEFQILLDKEIELLHSVDKIKQKVAEDVETQKVVNFFKTIGMPLRWTSDYKNISIEMDTIETQKGREYFQMYKSLCDKTLSTEQKLELYSRIKQHLGDHKCPTTEEMHKLIDRVGLMLARGMSKIHYMSVEKTIQKLMLHHFQQPECNEGVNDRMIRLKEERMKNKLICCKSCQKFKTMDSFALNARMTRTNVCNSCHWLNKGEDPLVDMSPYKYILKQIRKYELEHHGSTSAAMIVTVNDVYHIIDNIWHGKSALSECNDVHQLRLIRWNRKRQWSPWNCVPLTSEECKAHIRIKELSDVYDEHFMSTVFAKHALAKIQFRHLRFVEKCLSEECDSSSENVTHV